MKLRIRPALLTDLAASYRATNTTRASSSASTSTSTSTSSTRKTARPRRPDIPDELREQGIAPDTILTSTTGAIITKNYRPPPAWVVHSTGEEPHLKANPWADTYKITDSDLDVEDGIQPARKSSSQRDNDNERELFRHELKGIQSSLEDGHDAGQSSKRVRSRPESSKVGFGLRSKEAIAEAELAKRLLDTSSAAGPSVQARVGSEDQKVDLGTKEGDQAIRTIRFGTTERVDIKEGHLLYHHDNNVDTQEWCNGSETELPYLVLRDACPCPKCIHPSTRQRTHTSPEAYREIEASSFRSGVPDQFRIRHEKNEEAEGLRIQWSSDHSAFFPVSRLKALAIPGAALIKRLPEGGHRQFWTAKDIVKCQHLHVRYKDLISDAPRDKTLFNTLAQLHAFGIVVIKGVPTDKTGNEDCSLREVMGLIGEIRNTFYGETWNVRNVANSKNVAYTDVNLGLHADLLYFSSPPRFQALHCLRNRVEGGSSYFVDAFAAVIDMNRANPKTEPKIPKIDFEYDNDGHYLHYTHPLYTGRPYTMSGLHTAVNWSPPFQGLPRSANRKGSLSASEWYESLDLFQKTLDEPHREWEFTMEEGDLVLFDNRRVLHARRAFRDLTEAEREERGVEVVEGESSRWLKGCYLDGEVVWDKLAVLNRQLNGNR